jgi:spore germination protein GerM
MAKKLIIALTAVVLGICLLSGGCSSNQGADKVQQLKDLLQQSINREPAPQPATRIQDLLPEAPVATQEEISVTLYYGDQDNKGLVAESRSVEKTAGMARVTVQELFRGPAQAENVRLFPEGTQLLDINIKSDGLCIVDVSNHVRNVPTKEQAKLMVYSLVNTLGEYPTVKEVSLMIDGEYADSINYLDLSEPLAPNYDLTK